MGSKQRGRRVASLGLALTLLAGILPADVLASQNKPNKAINLIPSELKAKSLLPEEKNGTSSLYSTPESTSNLRGSEEKDKDLSFKSFPVIPGDQNKIATRAVQAADWDIENQDDGNFWPLSQKNELVKVDPISEVYRAPDIKYVGTYKNGDGKDVIRLQLKKYNTANQEFGKGWF